MLYGTVTARSEYTHLCPVCVLASREGVFLLETLRVDRDRDSIPQALFGGGGFSAVWDPEDCDRLSCSECQSQISCFYCTPLSDDAMDDAQKALDAAVARRTQIAELLVVARAAVDEDRRNNLR